MIVLLAGLGGLNLWRIVLFAIHLPSARATATLWIIGSSGILLGTAIVGAKRFGRREALVSLGMRVPRPIDLAVGVPTGVALYFGTKWLQDLINTHLAWWVSWYGSARTSVDLAHGPWIVVGLITIFLVPIGEESLVRGFFYRGLRTRYSIVPAVVLSAAVFAAYHVDPAVMPAIFIDGVVLALALEWRGTLGLPMVIHGSILACFFLESVL